MMANDYQSFYADIRKDHEKRYGTDISEYGKNFHEDFYADKTHFILELLQNAEDALKHGNHTDKTIRFELRQDTLSLRHFGKAFDEKDVKSICSISKSTKKLDSTTIGKFGIGFKSVYDFTNSPEIHSGEHHFQIKDYVHPFLVDTDVDLKPDETLIRLPLNDAQRAEIIKKGLTKLNKRTILFLRHIKTVPRE